MESWSDYGLPCPLVSGYQYGVDGGLIATPFDIGWSNRGRRWSTNPRIFLLTFSVTAVELKSVQEFADQYGYSWFVIPLITGDTGTSTPSDHIVRIISNLSITAVMPDRHTVSFQVEGQID